MKAVEYTTNISKNGVLLLPKKILQELNVMKNSKIKVVLLYEDEPGKKDLTRFCGKWQDKRDADTIIKEIYADRDKNIRSESVTKP
ncbi:MAG: hypothetical protein HOK24_10885 [Desulfobacula sp.]|jgi:hypothetical protein|uniref:hypothetical protein n=1 Tax=Desulfobacula sp. TaxID=2593537 RepID=UPI001D739AA7|nr:hypothetical protein [Desulfobacula sp.]MBT4197902.1 hypothetical protein [Desulfobacula sp.]MBT4507964.1 hypothetical protein [Desulfobacula sp.]MBT4873853.1 hypothetical protein [Desulfobacula sp.]MBT5544972.1 hypothetical protein [Desulfobacula sp.]